MKDLRKEYPTKIRTRPTKKAAIQAAIGLLRIEARHYAQSYIMFASGWLSQRPGALHYVKTMDAIDQLESMVEENQAMIDALEGVEQADVACLNDYLEVTQEELQNLQLVKQEVLQE